MAEPTVEWTKVLTNPIGLAGYSLCLLFGLLARVKHRHERRWILPSALVAAGLALVGGLGLAYRDVDHKAREAIAAQPVTTPTPVTLQHNDHVTQTSSGAGSPNVQGVQGNVTITEDQSTNTTPKSQTQRAKPKNAPRQVKTQ